MVERLESVRFWSNFRIFLTDPNIFDQNSGGQEWGCDFSSQCHIFWSTFFLRCSYSLSPSSVVLNSDILPPIILLILLFLLYLLVFPSRMCVCVCISETCMCMYQWDLSVLISCCCVKLWVLIKNKGLFLWGFDGVWEYIGVCVWWWENCVWLKMSAVCINPQVPSRV